MNRKYVPTEVRYRLRVFRENLKEIVECNEGDRLYKCTENEFTDLTKAEREAFTGLANITDNQQNARSEGLRAGFNANPDTKDWRDLGAVTAVKNQGQCGSCWTFSAIGAVEGAYKLATGVLKTFSEQNMLDCTYETMYPGYDGCSGGWYYDAYQWIMDNAHLSREINWPYMERDEYCDPSSHYNDLGAARLMKYVQVGAHDDYLADAIAITPVSVAMLSAGTFYSYQTGIYTGDDCQCNWDANHALTAVAYAPDSFVIKNSWGKNWGDNGFIRIARGLKHTVCRVADFSYYPIFSANGKEPTLAPTDAPVTTQVGPTDDNDGCPGGTVRCSDGVCKHVHMC